MKARNYSLLGDSYITREQVCTFSSDASPRVALFSSFDEKYASLANIARPNWERYCRQHGYALRFYPNGYHEDPCNPQTFGDKGKFQWYYDIRGLCDVAMWLDIDSLFMNMDIKIERVLQQEKPGYIMMPKERPFFYTYDDGGPLSGLWIARTDDLTEKHLRYAYEYAAANNNVRHGKIEPNGISDQDAFTRLMCIPPFNRTFGAARCFPAKEVGHCFPENYENGDWIVTFPGRSLEEKATLMKEWVARV